RASPPAHPEIGTRGFASRVFRSPGSFHRSPELLTLGVGIDHFGPPCLARGLQVVDPLPIFKNGRLQLWGISDDHPEGRARWKREARRRPVTELEQFARRINVISAEAIHDFE